MNNYKYFRKRDGLECRHTVIVASAVEIDKWKAEALRRKQSMSALISEAMTAYTKEQSK